MEGTESQAPQSLQLIAVLYRLPPRSSCAMSLSMVLSLAVPTGCSVFRLMPFQ
jgi:hypothetical protein